MTEILLAQPERALQPVFNEFVFKLNSRCPLQPGLRPANSLGSGCDYCYEYIGNTAWQQEPTQMSLETVVQAALRIDEHAQAHGIRDVRLILHGGEPLSFSASYLDQVLTAIGDTITNAKVHLSVQTNGLPLDEKKLVVLAAHNVAVGLSLDGDKRANDRHRRSQRGESVYHSVVEAADLLRAHEHKWGILSVIDTRNPPEYTLETHAARQPQSISFFPSHANHSSAPRPSSPEHLPLGAWQLRLFLRYLNWGLHHPDANGDIGAGPPFTLPIQDAHMMEFLGGKSMHERAGNRYSQELFITPSGKWQRLDTLKSTEQGAIFTGMNVFDHSLDTVAEKDPGIIARRMASTIGMHAMSKTCEACPFFQPCGGDYYTLRYTQPAEPLTPQSPAGAYVEAFGHPSVDCDHQKHLLGHMAIRLESDLGIPAGTLTGGRRVPLAETDAIMEQAGASMLVGHYIQLALNERLQLIEQTCPSIAPPDDRDALIRVVRLLNQQAILAPDESGQGDPIIPEELYTPLLQYIRHPAFQGRLSLYAYSALYRQDPFTGTNTKLAYHGSARPLLPQDPDIRVQRDTIDESGQLTGVFKDADDAIIQALFDPQETVLGEWFRPPVRCGDFYVSSSHSIRALYETRDTVQGLVYPVIIPEDEAESPVSHLGFTYYIPSPPQTIPTQVSLKDLPETLLVLEIPGATQAETESLMDEVRELAEHHASPYAVNEELKKRQPSAYLLPLSGFWTSRTNIGWYVPAKHDTARKRVALAFERMLLNL